MRWATRALIHFDRVASAWLILRFVDRDAQFHFLANGEAADDDVMLFGIQGARLAPHDGKATTFQRILDAYALNDPALAILGRIVADVVDHVMNDRDGTGLGSREPHVGGVLALVEGIMLLSATDSECLERSLPFYDALYARSQAQIVIERLAAPSQSASVLERTVQISNATGVLRKSRCSFSSDAFVSALGCGSAP
jgi:hypothetical protein